jgi:molybdate transport system ATP-binding protein
MIEISVNHQLGDLSLHLSIQADGGINALFGRSGCGKTTLINILAGLITPDDGRIAVGDKVLFDGQTGINVPPEHRRIGYVFQDARLFPHLSVDQNLCYGMDLLAPDTRRHTLAEISDLLELAPLLSRRPATLSGGERQRVAIGRALLSSPDLLLMDEPLASLDATHKSEILPFIDRLRDELGLPMFYVSHDIDEVVWLADTMIVLSHGKLEAQGSVEDILARLDLQPFTGRYEAGAAIAATVEDYDENFGLSKLTCTAGTLFIAGIVGEPGTKTRLRIRARDVSLATARPKSSSVLNVFKGIVLEIEQDSAASHADVLVDVGVPLIARITRRSISELQISPGREVFALVKAAAIDRPSGNRPNRGME